jgi:hypothetical protein
VASRSRSNPVRRSYWAKSEAWQEACRQTVCTWSRAYTVPQAEHTRWEKRVGIFLSWGKQVRVDRFMSNKVYN